MTMIERIRIFGSGAKEFIGDCRRYMLIRDASQTPINAWGNGIPRRQQEEQRRLLSDASMVAPLLAVCMIPIAGYIPIFLAVSAPRNVLSRQFHNDFETYQYACVEDQQRRRLMPKLQKLFWNSNKKAGPQPPTSASGDAAGPLLDVKAVWPLFDQMSIDTLPHEYLVPLALVTAGMNQNLPYWISEPLTSMLPSFLIRKRVRQAALALVRDDALLLLEGYAENECSLLADLEVLDACLMRGLPVNITVKEQRVCLANHLQLIKKLQVEWSENLGLFTLHLSILRDYYKRH
jgi:hypothetical protein